MSEVIYHRCDMCGEVRNNCETTAKRSEAEEDAHGC